MSGVLSGECMVLHSGNSRARLLRLCPSLGSQRDGGARLVGLSPGSASGGGAGTS
jgi:hypothetical protein